MRYFEHVMLVLSLGVVAGTQVRAQELEPGVQTSSSAAVPAAAAKPQGPATATPVTTTPGTGAAPAVALKAHAGPNPAAPGAKSGSASDRIQLDTTQISGNRELPKVMYVVPWRKADLGDFAGRPPNSLLDEALTPVDRDVFRRQNRYYDAVQGQAESSRSQPGAGSAGTSPARSADEK
jgi:hypothetical protein